MDLQTIDRTTKVFGNDLLIVRGGLSIFLYSDVPLLVLSSCVAEVLDKYLAYIPAKSLETYYATNGTYKKMTSRVLTSTLKTLRAMPKGFEFYEFHFGQLPEGGIGRYAVHFKSSLLNNPSLPLETNLMVLEFPANQLEIQPVEDFLEFVQKVGELFPYCSGNVGLAFQRPQSFSREARELIDQMMPRYLGLDPSYENCRNFMRGRSPSAHWLNLINHNLLEQIGGLDYLRSKLPSAVEILPAGKGIMIRGSKRPPLGDVNRGATDIEYLPDVARCLKPIRFEISGFAGNTDAAAWLARFDARSSVTS